jgi:hypothetical protein
MGIKKLLGTIQITDTSSALYTSSHPSGSASFRKVNFATVVYDEDDQTIECFDVPFDEITEDSRGFGGDYYNELSAYIVNNLRLFSPSGINTARACYVTSNNILLSCDGTTISYWDAKKGIQDEDKTFGGGTLSAAWNIDCDEANTLAYVSDNSNARIYVFNYETGASVSNFGSGTLTSPVAVRIDTVNDRAYVSDQVDGKIYVFKLSDGSHVSAEDMSTGITSPQGLFLDTANDRLYVADKGGTTAVHAVRISTQTIQASESIAITDPMRS